MTHLRTYSQEAAAQRRHTERQESNDSDEPEQGAFSRRLEQMTEEALISNPRRSGKMVEEAGFSEDLKRRLEERIASGNASSTNQRAASVVSMPTAAGKGTRDIAEAQPWSGTEKMEETALRMLEDAHKPLRGSKGGRSPVRLPPVDMRVKLQPKTSNAQRLANARDKTSIYSLSQEVGMSDKEKEEMRKMFKERFQPGARSIPASIQGLQSLASERIEDAIARGLFKNIPRGKGVNIERDHVASSPFLDTTEYFMNKIIQKQEVLPPWVEKQQEVTRTISTFRARLRNDWKRHAARIIASKGGTLEQQIRRAERYATAEAISNPRTAKQEKVASIDSQGNLTRVTIEQAPPAAHGSPDPSESPGQSQGQPIITVTEESTLQPPSAQADETPTDLKTSQTVSAAYPVNEPLSPSPPPSLDQDLPPPFRDPDWEKTELGYHTLALTSLNNLTRSYNLMAPELARKPYFSLERELKSCYADVAPILAEEIRQRARAPPERKNAFEDRHRAGSVLDRFGQGEKVRIWESRRPQYGFKEFWRDLWGNKTERS